MKRKVAHRLPKSMYSLSESCPTIEDLSQREREALEEGVKGEREIEIEEARYEIVDTRQDIESKSDRIAKNQIRSLRCNMLKIETQGERTDRRGKEETRGSIARSLSNKFQWLIMETISWMFVTIIEIISRLRARWASYRKSRRCKKQTLIDDLIAIYISFINCVTVSSGQKRGNELSERRQVICNYNLITNLDTPGDTSHVMSEKHRAKQANSFKFLIGFLCILSSISCCLYNDLSCSIKFREFSQRSSSLKASLAYLPLFAAADASLIIGDSAIEIQEVGDPNSQQQQQQQQQQQHPQSNNNNDQNNVQNLAHYEEPNLILGSTSGAGSVDSQLKQAADSVLHSQKPLVPSSSEQQQQQEVTKNQHRTNSVPVGPLPPIPGSGGSSNQDKQREDGSHDNVANELNGQDNYLSKIASAQPAFDDRPDDKAITGKVVDFELTPAGGHNKAKIKKKKKKKKEKEEEDFKKWNKKKESEKKAHEKKLKESMKKKKEKGEKAKKKWGVQEQGQKKKGKFKKKKWGKKIKKGKGEKKGKKGKKFLKDKGHKNVGFKNVYHKEEWGKSSKWHDIKREKKWDEKSKKWKKKWKKEKGKKYKGDHMKKFKKEKKSGKKYKKEKKEKFKKSKKEEFKKGKKEKMEEHGKKKEGGMKKEKKEEKKKKTKKKG